MEVIKFQKGFESKEYFIKHRLKMYILKRENRKGKVSGEKRPCIFKELKTIITER